MLHPTNERFTAEKSISATDGNFSTRGEEEPRILHHPPTDYTMRQEFSARTNDAINGALSVDGYRLVFFHLTA